MAAGRNSTLSPPRASASFRPKSRTGSVRPPWSQGFWRKRREHPDVADAACGAVPEETDGTGSGPGHSGTPADGHGGEPALRDESSGGPEGRAPQLRRSGTDGGGVS